MSELKSKYPLRLEARRNKIRYSSSTDRKKFREKKSSSILSESECIEIWRKKNQLSFSETWGFDNGWIFRARVADIHQKVEVGKFSEGRDDDDVDDGLVVKRMEIKR